MSFRNLSVATGLLCLGVSPSVVAGNPDDEIIVTANRTEQSIDTILAPVTVIDREKIDTTQAGDIYQLLKREVGIQLARNGSRSSVTTLFLRGTNSDHTLILIDGVRAGSATVGTTALESLSLDQVERIEIVRGPRSSLYGSDAIGGVIQIFTRQPQDGQTTVSLAAGSDNTEKVSLSTVMSYSAGSVGLTASQEKSDGFDVRFDDDELSDDPRFDKDDDEYELRDVSLRWQHRFSDSVRVSWSNLYSEDEYQYDTNFLAGSLPYSETRNLVSSLGAVVDVSDRWAIDLKAGFAEDDLNIRDKVDIYDSDTVINTERYDYSFSNRLQLSDDQKLVAGIDYVKEQAEPDYEQEERENIGTFAQYLLQMDKASFSLGARYDDSDSFGGTTTGDVAAGYLFSPALEVIVSHGTAFKAPTFNDLFFPDSMFSSGNPNVKPEESKTTEVALRGDFNPQSSYEVNLFYTDIENLIDWAANDMGKFMPMNVADARIQGVELAYNITVDSWNIAFNSSYIEPKDLTADEDLQRRARATGSIDISRRGDGYAMGLTVTGKSERKGDTDTPAGYGTVDIRFERSFGESVVAKLKVENLFDREFISVPGYNDVGRFALLEVQYKLKH